jgi:oligopeptide/dipeptide ABC transporter ATP-binding protein
MYAGQIVEVGSIYDVFDKPLHPYTQGLLRSVPSIRLDEQDELYKMPGEPPNLAHPPSGCRFHPRCPWVMEVCIQVNPALMDTGEGHLVHCWLYQDHPLKHEPQVQAGG